MGWSLWAQGYLDQNVQTYIESVPPGTRGEMWVEGLSTYQQWLWDSYLGERIVGQPFEGARVTDVHSKGSTGIVEFITEGPSIQSGEGIGAIGIHPILVAVIFLAILGVVAGIIGLATGDFAQMVGDISGAAEPISRTFMWIAIATIAIVGVLIYMNPRKIKIPSKPKQVPQETSTNDQR